MGRKLHYKLGDYYVTDDRTGFPQRSGQTKKEWNGLRVDEKVWEIRQPQDLVKGVKDSQWVPDARPLGPAQYVGPISVATTAAAIIGQTVIPVENSAGFYEGALVGCMLDLDGGTIFFTTIAPSSIEYAPGQALLFDVGKPLLYGPTPSGSSLALTTGLPYSMAAGNLITLYRPTPPAAPGL